MCKSALLAAMLAGLVGVATAPGDAPEGVPAAPGATADSRYHCWSSWLEFDAELVVTRTDMAVPEHAVPDTDPVETGGFTGVGWTFGNFFDELEDTGHSLGPGDYSNLELNSLTDVDGLSILVSI